MDEIMVRVTSRQRFNMLLLTIFGASGLLLAAIGVYAFWPTRFNSGRRSWECAWRLVHSLQHPQHGPAARYDPLL
jgi:hypothetical protein